MLLQHSLVFLEELALLVFQVYVEFASELELPDCCFVFLEALVSVPEAFEV